MSDGEVFPPLLMVLLRTKGALKLLSEVKSRNGARMRIQRAIESLPGGIRGAQFANLQVDGHNRSAFQACKVYASRAVEGDFRSTGFLTLFGDPGTGKTSLAFATIFYMIELMARANRLRDWPGAFPGCSFYVADEFVHELANMHVTPPKGTVSARKFIDHPAWRSSDVVHPSDWSQSEVAAVQHASRVGVLLLDDVGVSKPTEYARRTIFTILNSRLQARRPTIITSNLPPSRGVKSGKLDPRIASRLHERGMVLRLEGPDRRLSAKGEDPDPNWDLGDEPDPHPELSMVSEQGFDYKGHRVSISIIEAALGLKRGAYLADYWDELRSS